MTGESVQKSWTSDDKTCNAAGGKCQHKDVEKCNGENNKNGTHCGGPIERQCCVPHKKSMPNK